MPLVAMNQKNERVELWRYSTETMLLMRDKLKAGAKAFCPECGGEMTIKAIKSRHYIPHFAHLQSAQSDGCEYGRGESQEHLAAKSAIAEYISGFDFYAGASIHIEYRLVIPDGHKPTRRADVVAIMPNGDIHVHEAQLSAINISTLRERTSDCRQVSSEVVWWLGGKAENLENEHEAKILSIFGRIAQRQNKTILYSETAFLSQLEKRKNMKAYLEELTGGSWEYSFYHMGLYGKDYPQRIPYHTPAQSLADIIAPLGSKLKQGSVQETSHGGKATIASYIANDMYFTKAGTAVEYIDGILHDLRWAGHGRDFTRADGSMVTINVNGTRRHT